jgi:murein hydrolase activator
MINVINKNIKPLFLFFLLILFHQITIAGTAIEDSQTNLEELQKKIDQLDAEIKKNTETKKGLTTELKNEEKKISKSKKELYQIRKKERANKKKLTQLNADLVKLNDQIEEKKEQLLSHYYHIYTQGKPSYLQMLIEGSSPNKISRDMNYLSYVAKEQNDNIRFIKNQYEAIDKNKDETSKTLKKINSLKKKKESATKSLEKQKKEKAKVLNKIASAINNQKKTKQKLIDDEKKLTRIIETLIKKSKVEAKKRSQKQSIVADNETLPDSSLDDVNFKKLKKKLKLPVKGKIIHKYGKKRPDTGVTWKGLFIKANEGDEVYAIAKGKVVFSDWLRGFGNIIILDHGEGYMSLYGNNESLLIQQGVIVKGGQAVAIVGNSGGNESNGLYYELRKNSKPFNPLSWTTLK